jgi:hypothetical protein
MRKCGEHVEVVCTQRDSETSFTDWFEIKKPTLEPAYTLAQVEPKVGMQVKYGGFLRSYQVDAIGLSGDIYIQCVDDGTVVIVCQADREHCVVITEQGEPA